MPPRFAYWTLIVEGKPTAFRAHDRGDLVPTMRQLQARHPDTVMMWFARGRLWTSPEEAQAASSGPRRTPDWRPGGQHRDPRARFDIPRDEKRRRFAERQRRDRQTREGGGAEAGSSGGRHPTRGAGQQPEARRPSRPGVRPRGPGQASGPRSASGSAGAWRQRSDRKPRTGQPGGAPPRDKARTSSNKPPGRPPHAGGRKPGGGKPGGGRGRGGPGRGNQ